MTCVRVRVSLLDSRDIGYDTALTCRHWYN